MAGARVYAGRAWPPPGPRRPAPEVFVVVLALCWPVVAGPGSGHTRPAVTDVVARARQKRPPLAAPARACVAVVAWPPGDRLPRVGRGSRSITGPASLAGRGGPAAIFRAARNPLFLRRVGFVPRSFLLAAVAAGPPMPVFGCPGLSWRSWPGLLGTCCRASAWAAISRPPPSTRLGRGRGRSQPRQRDSRVTGETGGEQQRIRGPGGCSWALYGAGRGRDRPRNPRRSLTVPGAVWQQNGGGCTCPPP
jgi:hypothetical protein